MSKCRKMRRLEAENRQLKLELEEASCPCCPCDECYAEDGTPMATDKDRDTLKAMTFSGVLTDDQRIAQVCALLNRKRFEWLDMDTCVGAMQYKRYYVVTAFVRRGIMRQVIWGQTRDIPKWGGVIQKWSRTHGVRGRMYRLLRDNDLLLPAPTSRRTYCTLNCVRCFRRSTCRLVCNPHS